jgi:hypothetical protein
VPETELFTGDGSATSFTLTNYIDSAMIENAVVEINGIRQDSSMYTITPSIDDITFSSPPSNGDTVAVTTFNISDRQYFNTLEFNSATVSNIVNIVNAISPFLSTTYTTNTTAGTNVITCDSTVGFVVDQTIIFKGTSFGGIQTDGTIYFVESIINGTDFTIKDKDGNTVVLSTASGLLLTQVGGVPAVRITTGTPHGMTTNEIARIDGVLGSVQLNNNTYYVHVIDNYRVDLYSQPYDSSVGATNYPITAVSTYISGGYMWVNDTFVLYNALSSATQSTTNYIVVNSTSKLVVGTPIYFTEDGYSNGDTITGGIVAGQIYYVREVVSSTEFTITEIRYGIEFTLSTDTGIMTVCQWQQVNSDRLWVTINGYRVSSERLKINNPNYISVLSTVVPGDVVIISFMIPSATPNEEIYTLNINPNASTEPVVYRANTQTRTWLTKSLYDTEDIIYVNDVSRLTDTIIQNVVAPTPVDGIYSIGLSADKDLISSVTVYNNNPSRQGLINSANYEIVVESLSPILKITDGSYIDAGDELTITTVEGNIIYINGEQIKFREVDTVTNTLSGLQRGANITGQVQVHPIYSEIFSILSNNKITNVQYGLTWNSDNYNPTLGDPLQVSNTSTAIFLNQDIN